MVYKTVDFYSTTLEIDVTQRNIESNNMHKFHFHNNFELYYLSSGERNMFIKEKVISFSSGMLLLIHPNVIHRAMNSTMPNYSRTIVNFPQELIDKFMETDYKFSEIFNKEFILIEVPEEYKLKLERYLDMIVETVYEKHLAFEIELLGATYLFISLVYTLVREGYSTEQFSTKSNHITISKIVKYINENYTRKDLTIDRICDKFFISKYHLCRTFKEVTGSTISEYINMLRVKEAKRLIECTDFKIKTIGSRVGFSSLSNFNHTFKKNFGNSPSNYRIVN
jgi:AraC-like DNA-binding protein/quercetin dioxygenase-like cupin family protein